MATQPPSNLPAPAEPLVAMNRRHFIVSLSGLAAAVPGLTLAGQALAAAAPGPSASKPAPLPAAVAPPGIPTVHILAQDAACIAWEVASLCSGWVEYGPTAELGQTAKGAELGRCPVERDVLRIPLDNLKAGQTIHYRTVTAPLAMPNNYALRAGEAVVSPVHSFTMPSPAADRVKIAVWNDVHQQAKTLVALRQATEAYAPDLLVLNGDIVLGNFQTEAQFAEVFLREAKGVATTRWPVLFTRGNHDGYGPLANHLPRFVKPQQPEGYFQLLRVGPLALLLLDTGTDKTDDADILHGTGAYEPYRELQQRWLKQAIADPRFASAPFRLLCCHIPLRWREDDKNPDARCAHGERLWSPLLAEAKVQAVISGHTHRAWHSPPTAQHPYHQVVGGGPQTTSTHWSPTPATVTQITIDAGQLRIRVAEAVSGKECVNLTLDPVA